MVFSPAARRTYALRQFGRRPVYRPKRRCLPRTLTTRTSTTLTPKRGSTARRTSILLASRATWKHTVLVLSLRSAVFSVTIGRRTIWRGSFMTTAPPKAVPAPDGGTRPAAPPTPGRRARGGRPPGPAPGGSGGGGAGGGVGSCRPAVAFAAT